MPFSSRYARIVVLSSVLPLVSVSARAAYVDQTANVSPPKIDAVWSVTTGDTPQGLLVDGQSLSSGSTLRLDSPDGTHLDVPGSKVIALSPSRVLLGVPATSPGRWQLSVLDAKGTLQGSPFQFQVVGAHPAAEDIASYRLAFWIVTVTHTLLLLSILLSLLLSIKRGRWSLADALSEESNYQPSEIQNKNNLILLASTSRLIALLGLLGVLATVLGIGYAAMWSLFAHGTVPELSSIRTLLYGSACLFIPYLANQLRAGWEASLKTSPPVAPVRFYPPNSAAITGVAPLALMAAPAVRTLWFTGSNFQAGASLTITDPQQAPLTILAANITDAYPTLMTVDVTLAEPGNWKAAVANPGADLGPPFTFTVSGAPTILGVEPKVMQRDAAVRDITVIGMGFMRGCTVELRDSAAQVANRVVQRTDSTKLTITAAFPTAGAWTVTVRNGTLSSPPLTFQVS